MTRSGLGRLLSVMALVAAVAACGSKEGPGVASAGGDRPGATATAGPPAGGREEQARQFAQCMRDNGVDLPDPEPGGGFVPGGSAGGGPGAGLNPSDPNFQAAFTACRSKLPNGGEPPRLNPEQLEQYRAFATCMREHGVDLPDPNPDGTLQLGGGRGLGQIDRTDPSFRAAITACRDQLTGVFPRRSGPSGSPR